MAFDRKIAVRNKIAKISIVILFIAYNYAFLTHPGQSNLIFPAFLKSTTHVSESRAESNLVSQNEQLVGSPAVALSACFKDSLESFLFFKRRLLRSFLVAEPILSLSLLGL